MHETLHLIAVASIFPLMALVLALPFHMAAWLRGNDDEVATSGSTPAHATRAQPRSRMLRLGSAAASALQAFDRS